MRTLRIIYLAAAFYLISAVSLDDENYQNFKIDRKNVEREVPEAKPPKLSHDSTSTTIDRISSDKKDGITGSHPLLTRHGKRHRRRRCKNRPMCSLMVISKQRFSSQSYEANDSHNPYLSPIVKSGKEILIAKEQNIVSRSFPFEDADAKQLKMTDVIINNTFHTTRSNQRVQTQIIDDTISDLIDKNLNASNGYAEGRKVSSDAESKTLVKDNEESMLFGSLKLGEIDIYDENDFEDIDVPPWNRRKSSNDEMAVDKNDYMEAYDASSSSISASFDPYFPFHGDLAALLTKLFQTLRNVSAEDSHDILKELNFIANMDEDPCQKWLNSWDKFEQAVLGSLIELPACPCQYPSNIFYDDKIWDEEQQKYFRWRDVSGDSQRLDIYKPGATYCVRSLLTQGSGSAAAQHCCYDHKRKLLTRGSGAGTPNFVSPEISTVLHERIDVLPWRLCKGDFSRFNKVRPPNNDNGCEINPDDEEYQRQIDDTKYY